VQTSGEHHKLNFSVEISCCTESIYGFILIVVYGALFLCIFIFIICAKMSSLLAAAAAAGLWPWVGLGFCHSLPHFSWCLALLLSP
jgi:hypothetical protein